VAVTSMMPSEIVVRERFRLELGDIDGLAESISELGLIQPIAVYPDGTLVAGYRRLVAWMKLMPDTPIPVLVLLGGGRLAALQAEIAENTCRHPMALSEISKLAEAILREETLIAAERRRVGNSRGGKAEVGAAPGTDLSKSRDVVAAAVGVGHTRLGQALVVTRAADSDPDPQTRELAKREVEEMDRTGKVAGPYKRVKAAQDRAKRVPADDASDPPLPAVRRASRTDLEKVIPSKLAIIVNACASFTKIGVVDLRGISTDLRNQWSAVVGECRQGLAEFAERMGDEAD
jgi:ParB family transcriptional regulator, chromosome partitioning protein